jgi:predicted nuclease of predicted toxin-antitoxin system
MRFKIDEILPVEVADLLRMANYDAITVLEQDLGGAPDSHLLMVCQQEDRILISLDMDFADIRTYPPDEYPGLVVLRLHRQDKLHIIATIHRLLPIFATESPDHVLWIVGEDRIRVRS